jgi:hypothetical protein
MVPLRLTTVEPFKQMSQLLSNETYTEAAKSTSKHSPQKLIQTSFVSVCATFFLEREICD